MFSSSKITPTFISIYSLFGPTYPGSLCEDNIYCLEYPGISFEFPLPESMLPLKPDELPFLSKDKTTPTLLSISIFYGERDEIVCKSLDENFELIQIHVPSF